MLLDVLLLCCYNCAAWIAAALLCVSQAVSESNLHSELRNTCRALRETW